MYSFPSSAAGVEPKNTKPPTLKADNSPFKQKIIVMNNAVVSPLSGK